MAEIVERALDVNRMRRFPDLGHLVDALRAANSELSSSVPSMDLSEWLRQLFPNRKVVPSTTTVEATRTALAEEPIVVRSEVPAPVNMSTGELKEFGDATTGSHRSQLARDYVSKQAKKGFRAASFLAEPGLEPRVHRNRFGERGLDLLCVESHLAAGFF